MAQYLDVSTIVARDFTVDEYNQREGVIDTMYGSASFQPGDYWCWNYLGWWVVAAVDMDTTWYQTTDEDYYGYAQYRCCNPVNATDMGDGTFKIIPGNFFVPAATFNQLYIAL